MNIKISPFFLASLLCLSSIAMAKSQDSGYRSNLKVDFIHREYYEHPYSTDWFARLEKKTGTKRTIYIEASGKLLGYGFFTFDCAKSKDGVKLDWWYGMAEFGDASEREQINISFKDFQLWEQDKNELLSGGPPYIFYKKLRTRYCKK